MTSALGRRVALWSTIGVVWIAAGLSSAEPIASANATMGTQREAPGEIPTINRDSVRSGASMIREHDLFRLERKPSLVRSGMAGQPFPVVPPAPAAPSRPTLTLGGVIEGTRPHAVIEGIPGHERGALLRPGEEVGGIRLLRMIGDTVVLQGMDTTWMLTRKRAWQQ